MTKNEILVIVSLVGIAGAAIGYAFGQRKKLNDISAKIDKSINEMSESVEVTVDDAIVRSAVKKAVNRETGSIVEREVEEVSKAVVGEMRASIKKTLEDRIMGGLTEEDYHRMRSQVLDQASQKAAKKMTDGLEYIFDDFRRNMRRVANKYDT